MVFKKDQLIFDNTRQTAQSQYYYLIIICMTE